METTSPSTLSDFPKVRCPFVRQTFKVGRDGWREHGSRLGLRAPEVYLVVNQINPGFEWVFDDPETLAVEKLDGTNVKIKTVGGRLVAVQNRLNVIDPLQVIKGKTFIIEGIFRSIGKGYVKEDGEQAGEVIGPKLQGNPYRLEHHEWYPFDKAVTDLAYRSFHEHARTFENWSTWFRNGLHSRYFTKRATKAGSAEKVFAEGVIFYNLKRREQNQSWMAKLRRNMFDWYYSEALEIEGYAPEGLASVEDQERFD